MPVTLTIKSGVSLRTISRIITNLKRSTSPELIESLDLSGYERSTLKYLKRVFPVGKKDPRGHNREEFGMSMREGWDTHLLQSGDRVAIFLRHSLENNPRAETVLSVLDTGSVEQTLTVQKTFTFYSTTIPVGKAGVLRSSPGGGVGLKLRSGFVTFGEGKKIRRPAREGSDYTGKTYRYIVEVLIPKIQRDIRRQVKKFMTDG